MTDKETEKLSKLISKMTQKDRTKALFEYFAFGSIAMRIEDDNVSLIPMEERVQNKQ